MKSLLYHAFKAKGLIDTLRSVHHRYLCRRNLCPRLLRAPSPVPTQGCIDMESGHIIWVGQGRDGGALREFWRRFKLSGARL